MKKECLKLRERFELKIGNFNYYFYICQLVFIIIFFPSILGKNVVAWTWTEHILVGVVVALDF